MPVPLPLVSAVDAVVAVRSAALDKPALERPALERSPESREAETGGKVALPGTGVNGSGAGTDIVDESRRKAGEEKRCG